MSDGRSSRQPDRSDAAWAHNRWPTVGIYTGAGIGVVLGVVLFASWVSTLLYVIAFAFAGGLVGFLTATFVYRGSGDDGEDDEETR